MASRFTRAALSCLMVVTASAGAAGCAPPDESGEARPVATTVAPPRPAVISFVTPAIGQVPAPARPAPPAPPASPASPTPTTVQRAVTPGPVPDQAPVAVPPGLGILSVKIEHVMVDLDQLVEASLQLQYSLLRLRLRLKHQPQPAPPEPDLAELPVGL